MIDVRMSIRMRTTTGTATVDVASVKAWWRFAEKTGSSSKLEAV
jgi:hypothetical protein